jgi:hypothetical protein
MSSIRSSRRRRARSPVLTLVLVLAGAAAIGAMTAAPGAGIFLGMG